MENIYHGIIPQKNHYQFRIKVLFRKNLSLKKLQIMNNAFFT